jgi:lipopolysaccharide transport system permease protein
MIAFNLFSEPIGRAPMLIVDNAAFVKRVVFPLRIMPWMSMATAAFGGMVSLLVLVCFHFVLAGPPPATALLAPLALVPVCLLALGASWLLAAAGVFVRDVKHMVNMGMTLMMFVTPIFYPLSAVPERLRVVIYANPMSYSIETFRGLLITGVTPPAAVWIGYAAGCLAFAAAGYAVFARFQRRFADVV